MTQITIKTIEEIYNLQSCLEDLEYRLRSNRSWLLREYITMDWYKDGKPEHAKEVADNLNESLREVNECLDALGLGHLNLDIYSYVTDIVKKAKDKSEIEKLRAEEYLHQVWNDQTPHERKKLMTAYLDGMLAADISNKKGGEK